MRSLRNSIIFGVAEFHFPEVVTEGLVWLVADDELVTVVLGINEVFIIGGRGVFESVEVLVKDSLAISRPYQPRTIAITISAISIKAPAKYLPESFFLLDIPHTTHDLCQRL